MIAELTTIFTFYVFRSYLYSNQKMSLFCVSYQFKAQVNSDLQELRDSHQSYISKHVNKIVFGGVKLDLENKIAGILIVINVVDIEDARRFIYDDPYYVLTASYDINFFEQKIPQI